jgi:hypothetical protein
MGVARIDGDGAEVSGGKSEDYIKKLTIDDRNLFSILFPVGHLLPRPLCILFSSVRLRRWLAWSQVVAAGGNGMWW